MRELLRRDNIEDDYKTAESPTKISKLDGAPFSLPNKVAPSSKMVFSQANTGLGGLR